MPATPLTEIYQTICIKMREQMDIGIIKWYDIDLGQTEPDSFDFPVDYPAVFVKFDDVIWRDKDDTVQVGTLTVSFKIIFQFQKEEEFINLAPDGRGEVLDFLNNLELLHQAIITISGGTFNKLRRFNQYQGNSNPKDLRWVQVLQYQCNVYS
ncbi:MAG: hypothetical protein ABI855_13435, partial [Bacteroidota bacterium]